MIALHSVDGDGFLGHAFWALSLLFSRKTNVHGNMCRTHWMLFFFILLVKLQSLTF